MYGDNQNNQEKKEAGDILFDWKRKFDNFMYHYKFLLFAMLAIAAIVLFAAVQCAAKTDPDVNIAYAGIKNLDVNEMNSLQDDFKSILGEDLNGDGNIFSNFTHFLFMTDVQVEDARAQGEIVDVRSVRTVQSQLGLEVLADNNIIYFLSPEAYRAVRRINDISSFMYIDEALGYMPESHILFDECAISLIELACYYDFEGIGTFPEDTLIAIRDLRAEDSSNKELSEKYERNLKMFKKIVEFTYSE